MTAPVDPRPHDPVAQVLVVCHANIAASQSRPFVPGPDGPEDVDDPFGGPDRGYETMARRVEGDVAEVAAALFGAPG